MKKHLTLAYLATYIFFSFLGAQSFAQSNDSIFNEIKSKYKSVLDNLKSYLIVKFENDGESTEGGEGEAYYEGNKIRLIQQTWYGETGKRTTGYYFDEEKLFFVLDSKYKYNRPIYWDAEQAKESNDKETFDPKKTTINEDRYYISNDKLIRWIDQEKKQANLSDDKNSIVGQKLIAEAYRIKSEQKK